MPKKGETRELGRTGLQISAIGLGCWQFSRGQGLGGQYWGIVDQSEVNAIVQASLAGGINWFDTAEAYGHGESERALARALTNLGCSPGQIVIATKWRPVLRGASSILKTIAVRRENLDGFPIDLYQVHNPYSFSRVEDEMAAMAGLVLRGKIGHVGVSNFAADRMRRAETTLAGRGLHLASNQVRYSLLDRRIEVNGVLDLAERLGVTIIAYSPLAQGILSGKFHAAPELIKNRPGYRKYFGAFKAKGLERSRPVVEAVREIAARHKATPSQVALSWVIHSRGPLVVAIPGATTALQAAENAAALKLELTREEMSRLSEVSAPFRT